MKPTFAVLFLLVAPSLFAQGSPLHSRLKSSEAMGTAADRRPPGPSEKQAALESAADARQPEQAQSYSAPTTPAPVYEPSPDHTTSDEVDALAAKLRKIREAREAKAKAEQKKQ